MEKPSSNRLHNIDAAGIFSRDNMTAHADKYSEKSYKKGAFIYMKGDSNEYIYYIRKGRAKTSIQGDGEREIIKAVLEEGEVFGEMALINDKPRTDCAVALEDTELRMIHKRNITELFEEPNELQNYFLKLLGKRVLEVENRLQSLIFKDSRTRIVHFLLSLVEKKGERIGYEFVVRKFLTHQEIAYITATSRQTVTTVLNDLRVREMIKFDRRRLLIRDKARLLQEGS